MKSAKQKKNKRLSKKILIAAIIIVLAILTLGVYSFALHQNVIPNTQITDEQKAADAIKNNSVNSPSDQKTSSSSDQPPAPTPQNGGKSVVDVSKTNPIDGSHFSKSTDDSITFHYSISTSVSTGTCTLTLTKSGSDAVVRTAQVFASGPTTSTCQSLAIPLTELASGTWTTDLVFENDTLTGHASGSIVVE
ncbi:MAG: hypothetical protein JWO99_849 [Candidatus Saccharibacteria bacterium]|nr:hypothetical protein [Candidatus Saccharibacteria bacterium]